MKAGKLAVLAVLMLLALPGAARAQLAPVYHVAYGPSSEEQLTVFPQQSAAPILVLVHGGWWNTQLRDTELESQALWLQSQGLAVFDLNYPQSEGMGTVFPREVEAIEAGTRWSIANAARYGADASRVVLLGGSAGGTLTGLAAEHFNALAPGTIDGEVSLSSPQDLGQLVREVLSGEAYSYGYLPLVQALSCRHLENCAAAFEQEWSPDYNAHSSSCAPTLLAGSLEEKIIPVAQQYAMRSALQRAQCPVQLLTPPKGHSFAYWLRIREDVLDFIRQATR